MPTAVDAPALSAGGGGAIPVAAEPEPPEASADDALPSDEVLGFAAVPVSGVLAVAAFVCWAGETTAGAVGETPLVLAPELVALLAVDLAGLPAAALGTEGAAPAGSGTVRPLTGFCAGGFSNCPIWGAAWICPVWIGPAAGCGPPVACGNP